MIYLKRSRNLKDVHASFTGEGLLKRLEKLCRERQTHGDAIVWKGDLGDWKKMKRFLTQDSHGKCAYCESNTSSVAHGDVEHFRPKSVYWWLAFCVDNYVFACQLCNQTHKKDYFPIRGTRLKAPRLPASMPTTAAARRRLLERICPDPVAVDDAAVIATWLKERADLPHPYLEDPEPFFAWAPVETNEEVHLVVPEGASGRARQAVDAAVAYLGLNRETLTRTRYQVYASLGFVIAMWKTGDARQQCECLARIKQMCRGDQQFAGMCRYFARLAGVPL